MRPPEKPYPTGSHTRPLQGRTILITRPRDQGEEFAQLLEKNGASILFVPTIQIVPPSAWDQCDGAIATLDAYDGLIFTSANAVRYFFQRVKEREASSLRPTLAVKPVYVVGEKTGDAVVQEGLASVKFPEVHDAHDLAVALMKLAPRGKRFLFPKGDLAGTELAAVFRSNGATVDEIVVYRTVAPRDEDAKTIRESLSAETIDVATFFSPSSVRNLLGAVERELLTSCVIAVIGSSTAAAVDEYGFKTDIIAPKPTATALAEAITYYFTSNR